LKESLAVTNCVFVKGSKIVSNLNIHKRWSKEFFDPSLLPNYTEENPQNEQNEETKFEIDSQETIIHANYQDREPHIENSELPN